MFIFRNSNLLSFGEEKGAEALTMVLPPEKTLHEDGTVGEKGLDYQVGRNQSETQEKVKRDIGNPNRPTRFREPQEQTTSQNSNQLKEKMKGTAVAS